ncbi:MAG: iron-sulfur cluster-binding protein [Chloroflexi bacterium]|nr:iron-sulfur cluster-binding protein [Chloroflexota bacterium]
MEIKTKDFVQASRKAIGDPRLQQAVRRATTNLLNGRDQAVSEVDDWEDLRDQARAIKERTIERLDEYLALLADSVTRAGGVVFWAKTAEEANDYIISLARARGVKTIVKGKSMVTEETGLNHRLEEAGIEPIETDLGEYVIQMAGETPFHIIAPAIHKTREDFGQLFAEKLGVEYEDDPEKLTRIARVALREKFFRADMGVTGVNFGVAETGTIVLVENEGNQRLSTSLPPLHVAVMGMERVVPTLEDLSVFLTLLPRSATGQKASSYVSFITGPRGPGEIDGPKEFHLVILDNGRSRILKKEGMRESLYCIRCAACLNVCPIYNKVGGHAYGWVYSGPIGAIITPQLVGLDKTKDLPAASTLCGACRDICPVKIDIPRMLLSLRHQASEPDEEHRKTGSRPNRWERAIVSLWARGMKSPWAYGLGLRVGRLLQRPYVKDGRITRLPFFLSRWTRHRDFPPLAPKSFRAIWKERLSRDVDR